MNKKYLVIKCTAYIYLLNTLPEETGRTVSRKDIYILQGEIELRAQHWKEDLDEDRERMGDIYLKLGHV